MKIKTAGQVKVCKIKSGQTFLYKGENAYIRVNMNEFNDHWNKDNPDMIPAVYLQNGLFCVFHPDTKVVKANIVAELKLESGKFNPFLYETVSDCVE